MEDKEKMGWYDRYRWEETIEELSSILKIFACLIVIFAVVMFIVVVIIRKKESKKPLQVRKVKVLEKSSHKGQVDWYVVEFENGERTKLRNFKPQKILIAVGDVGTLSYRGITIESFCSLRE